MFAKVTRWVLNVATVGLLPMITRPLRFREFDGVTKENLPDKIKDILKATEHTTGADVIAPDVMRMLKLLAEGYADSLKQQDKALRYIQMAVEKLTKNKPAGKKD